MKSTLLTSVWRYGGLSANSNILLSFKFSDNRKVRAYLHANLHIQDRCVNSKTKYSIKIHGTNL